MVRRVCRVCRARYARLDGEGAKLVGGRWNSPGRAVVYMAESVALSVLENLVHMSRQDFPTGYVCIAAILPGTGSACHTTIPDFATQGEASAVSGVVIVIESSSKIASRRRGNRSRPRGYAGRVR